MQGARRWLRSGTYTTALTTLSELEPTPMSDTGTTIIQHGITGNRMIAKVFTFNVTVQQEVPS